MNVAVLTPRKTFTITNKNRHINRLKTDFRDYSLSDPEKTNRILVNLESESVTTTLQEDKAQKIQGILYSMQPLIQKRNQILANPFSWLIFPWRKKELKKIDKELDELDWQLYMIDSSEGITEAALYEIEQRAEKRLNSYSKYLPKK